MQQKMIQVNLIDSMGHDLRIVNAARVSYDKESSWDTVRVCRFCDVVNTILKDHDNTEDFCPQTPMSTLHHLWVDGPTFLTYGDSRLINFLMKNRHGTPFEMVVFTFRVTVPIFVAREWQRHRIGSYNEVSTRYVEMEPNFYIPPPEDIRVQVGKPGAYTYEPAEPLLSDQAIEILSLACGAAYASYEELLGMGIAREVARNVLPLALFTSFYWTVNARSLMNFLSLRLAPNALREIQYGAQQCLELVKPVIPVTIDSWETNGRQSP